MLPLEEQGARVGSGAHRTGRRPGSVSKAARLGVGAVVGGLGGVGLAAWLAAWLLRARQGDARAV